jgi:hypothetical protein
MRHRPISAAFTSLLAATLGVLAAACSSSSSSPEGDTLDAGSDTSAAFDATGEAADAGADVADGASIDAAPEAGTDASLDSGTDAPLHDGAPDAMDAATGSLGALSFDGIADYVHLPAATGGASEVAFSVELWFRTTSITANTGSMFEVYNSQGAADRFLSLNSGAVCFYVYTSPPQQVCTTATTYGDDAWHHAAGTLGTVGGMNLYVDGQPAASSATTTASTFNTDTDFRIGMGHTGFVSAIVYFQGDLDEVRVWSVERSAADIAANYKRTIDPTTAGLQGYWKLDETGTASVTADATSGANDGQLMNFTFTPSPWISPGAF